METKTVVITGASSGIGKALAFEYAKRGYHLGLTARRLNLLEEIKQQVEQQYSSVKVEILELDVMDERAVFAVMSQFAERFRTLDVIIINAGVSLPCNPGTGKYEKIQKTFQTNLTGAIATIEASVEILKRQKSGQIVGISSVAAFRGLPGNAAYSASKAALSTYMEGIRNHLRKHHIDVTVLHPGFIHTPLVEKLDTPVPFMISVEKGARQIADLIEKRVYNSTIPVMPWSAVSKLMRAIPDKVWARFGR
ncbi:MAG: SDR family oxidoreductase [SAR324 cluster bacterium]|nr:SDR family oxidoreductase [SAR324 cluster bacterium]